jgi:hypothetical protein
MPALFDLLREESEPGVRVVLAHFFFVNVHPYLDGNGRMWRFLMNAMLASGGYRWTVMPLAQRTRYMSALESASIEQDIGPFTDVLAELVERRQGQPPIIIRSSFPMMTMSIIAHATPNDRDEDHRLRPRPVSARGSRPRHLSRRFVQIRGIGKRLAWARSVALCCPAMSARAAPPPKPCFDG